jgi:hypothetical protein
VQRFAALAATSFAYVAPCGGITTQRLLAAFSALAGMATLAIYSALTAGYWRRRGRVVDLIGHYFRTR